MGFVSMDMMHVRNVRMRMPQPAVSMEMGMRLALWVARITPRR
jgi:hypothetical protein